ncbi:hypothetical protein CPC08DRAFT_667116 [Agrocybe pediades]|nr:hypothetical protein CPC08DRAFT_667116 [Agrocybe pediades]
MAHLSSALANKERLLSAAKDVFAAIKKSKVQGILVGGAAAVLLGQNRTTRDVDINVTKFPSFKMFSPEVLYTRKSDWPDMLKVTHRIPGSTRSDLSCDLGISKAAVMPLYMKYAKEYEEYPDIKYASLPLLLADKITTCAERRGVKVVCDISDVVFCLEQLLSFTDFTKMPEDLKSLYTQEHWVATSRNIKNLYGDDLEYYQYLMEIAEHFQIPHVPEPTKNE